MGYVYKVLLSRFVVGFYDAQRKWNEDGIFNTREEASDRVHYLNGGNIVEKKSKNGYEEIND